MPTRMGTEAITSTREHNLHQMNERAARRSSRINMQPIFSEKIVHRDYPLRRIIKQKQSMWRRRSKPHGLTPTRTKPQLHCQQLEEQAAKKRVAITTSTTIGRSLENGNDDCKSRRMSVPGQSQKRSFSKAAGHRMCQS